MTHIYNIINSPAYTKVYLGYTIGRDSIVNMDGKIV